MSSCLSQNSKNEEFTYCVIRVILLPESAASSRNLRSLLRRSALFGFNGRCARANCLFSVAHFAKHTTSSRVVSIYVLNILKQNFFFFDEQCAQVHVWFGVLRCSSASGTTMTFVWARSLWLSTQVPSNRVDFHLRWIAQPFRNLFFFCLEAALDVSPQDEMTRKWEFVSRFSCVRVRL